MLLFVGLGNPGPKYESTRHNIGFRVAEAVAEFYGFPAWRSRFQGLATEGLIAGEKILLLKPLTYMNESGRSVGEALRFFKLEPAQVTVFYDEIDLAPGKMRVKTGGGAGGHNGIRNIDRHIGKDYRRVRLGVGHPGDKDRVHGYVLSDFTKVERLGWVHALVDAVARELPALVKGDEGRYMSRVAHAVFPPPPKTEKSDAPDPGANPDEPTSSNGA